MYPPNDTGSDHLPVLDKWPQPLRMEYKAWAVQRRNRIAARKEGKKALCAGIHSQDVPTSVEHKHGIGFKLRHEKFHRLACCL
jgi:hypothetical protein